MAESNEEPVAVGSIDLSINIGDLSGWPQLFQLLQGHDKFRKIVRVGKDYLSGWKSKFIGNLSKYRPLSSAAQLQLRYAPARGHFYTAPVVHLTYGDLQVQGVRLMSVPGAIHGSSQSQFAGQPHEPHMSALSHPHEVDHAVSAHSSRPGPLPMAEERTVKPWAHLVAGGVGGMTAAALTSPLDVLRTRLQSDFYQAQIAATRHARGIPPPSAMSLPRSTLLHFSETIQMLFSIHRVEGWRALFKGLGPNLVGVVPAKAINFYSYGNGKRIISEKFNDGQETAWVHLCAAIAAGIITGTATNPIWLVKTRLQLDKSNAERARGAATRQYRSSLDCVMQTVRAEGIRGLYRGLSASYLGVSESTIQWVLYEQMKGYLKRKEEALVASGRPTTWRDEATSMGGRLCAAGSAKFFATVLTYPHEVARTRLRQAPMQNRQLKYTGLVQCFRTMVREEGIMALYGGLTPHLLRVIPSAAITFGMYEGILRLLNEQA